MAQIPPSLQRLIEAFNRLPGIGPKTAERYAYHLLNAPQEQRTELANAVQELMQDITQCHTCFGIFDRDPCTTCSDAQRDQNALCVVSESTDVTAIERTGAFRGRYHVLGGVINPVEGTTADDLRIRELVDRLAHDKGVTEVIIATDTDMNGESTALYLKKALRPAQVRLTRIGHGLPMGATVEYADEVTLANAFSGRRPLENDPED